MRLLLITLFAVFQLTSFAATTTYTDRGLFEARLSTSIVDDYEDPGYHGSASDFTDAEMSSVLGETRYHTTFLPDFNRVYDALNGNHFYCAGCNSTYLLDFTSTSLSIAGGVDAVGLDFSNEQDLFFNRGRYSAFITFGDGSTESFPLPEVLMGEPANANFEFFGIISTNKIAIIHFSTSADLPSNIAYFAHDNLIIGRVVPESSSICLCVGLIVLLAIRRRG